MKELTLLPVAQRDLEVSRAQIMPVFCLAPSCRPSSPSAPALGAWTACCGSLTFCRGVDQLSASIPTNIGSFRDRDVGDEMRTGPSTPVQRMPVGLRRNPSL